MDATTRGRDLRPLFDPTSVAVIGASNEPGKWGYWLARGALRGEARRAVFLVNRGGGTVLSRPAYRSVAELPEPPELSVIAVSPSGFEAAVGEALSAGTKAIVAINAGFAETGASGQAAQDRIVTAVRSHGAVLLGPNCLGVLDNTVDLEAAWVQVDDDRFPVGPIGIISQSGSLGQDIMLVAREAGLGISRFASVGNQADVTVAELVRAFAAHDETKVIAVYCEDFRDGRDFLGAVGDATSVGKHVIVLAPGSGEAASRAARSHTGALTSDARVLEAGCRAAGAIGVSTPGELIDVAQLLLLTSRPRGRRLAVVSDGGGHAVVAAHVAALAGLEVPRFSAGLCARLDGILDPTGSVENPVDLAATGSAELLTFEYVVEAITSSGEVDGILMTGTFGGLGSFDTTGTVAGPESDSGRRMAAMAAAAQMSLMLHTVFTDSEAARATRDAGAALYRDPLAAARALATVAESLQEPVVGLPTVPEVGDDERDAGYFAVRRLLARAGMAFPAAEEVSSAHAAREAASRIGYPVVLKAVELLHKSDAGGVALGLRDADQLEDAFADMSGRLRSQSYAVEAMVDAAGGVELVVGCRRDTRFGPVLMVGLGGIYAEVFDDVAVALAPVTSSHAARLLSRLRAAPLLEGARGRRRLAIDLAADIAASLSVVAAANPSIAEIELNPLLVGPDYALALDARMVLVEEAASAR